MKTKKRLKLKESPISLILKNYAKQIKSKLDKTELERKVVILNFKDIQSFSSKLSDALLDNPEETLSELEYILSHISKSDPLRIRLVNLPKNNIVKIADLRAKHLNKFIQVEGKILSISPVTMRIISARFECPKCKTIISILQLKAPLKNPTKCSCKNKDNFKQVSREIVDCQQLILKDPHTRNNSNIVRVQLQEDLTDLEKKKIVNEGKWVNVSGNVRELPLGEYEPGEEPLSFHFLIEANNIIKIK